MSPDNGRGYGHVGDHKMGNFQIAGFRVTFGLAQQKQFFFEEVRRRISFRDAFILITEYTTKHLSRTDCNTASDTLNIL